MRYLLFVFSIALTFSCSNHSKSNKAGTTSDTSLGLKAFMKRMPVYSRVIDSNTDTILLGFTKGATEFDTSWSLIVSKQESKIVGRYSELLPIAISPKSSDEDSRMTTFYQGFTFDITPEEWNKLIVKSHLVNHISRDTVLYTGCFHCPRYFSYYNLNYIVSSKTDYSYLKSLDSLLKHDLLDVYMKRGQRGLVKEL